MSICGNPESIELETSAVSRMRGMLFRDPDEVTRLLVPCKDVHTFGMRYPLDIAFISRDGKVLEVHRKVSSKTRIKRSDASMVAERFSRKGDWLKAGDVIHLGSVGDGAHTALLANSPEAKKSENAKEKDDVANYCRE